MSSLNKALIIGRLGAEPEVRSTQAGQTVCTMRVATNEFSGKGADKKETVEWHKVIAWGDLAEICGEYLRKGRQVYIEGRLQTRKWQDKEGHDRYTTEIVARDVQFLGAKGDGDVDIQRSGSLSGGAPAASGVGGGKGGGNHEPQGGDNDDIPF